MDYLVSPSVLNNDTITVPGDKSITHRALILASIADGKSEINGYLNSDDCLSTLRALKKLGVSIEKINSTKIIVNGVGLDGLTSPDMNLDLGNSGTSMRLLAGLLSGQSFDTTLVGDTSLSRRPMKRITDPLEIMNGKLRSPDEFVRHKILDLIGDISLCGYPLIGHIRAHKAGHALHTALATTLVRDSSLCCYVSESQVNSHAVNF